MKYRCVNEFKHGTGRQVNRMNDLISRESLIEHLRQFAPEHYSAIVNDVIMREPVAFDKDKVLDQMRHEHADAVTMYLSAKHTAHEYSSEVRKDAWEEAIRIVEKGGIE